MASLYSQILIVTYCVCVLAASSHQQSSEAKAHQSISSVNTPNIEQNVIPGSSDYVPEQPQSNIGNFVAAQQPTLNHTSHLSTTRSEANVYQGSTTSNLTGDPLLVNAQSPNPFISGGSGGMNPQVALLLQNNPRLAMLARQNPLVAQQIMRNPALLRDPAIQRAIGSQLSPGQGQNLLGQLGQLGLRALNPFGLPLGGLNPMLNRQNNNNNNNNNPLSNQNSGQQGMGGLQNRGQQSNNGAGNGQFGLPRTQQQPKVDQHTENLPGGYYGNNYNPSAENNAANNGEGAAEGGQDDGSGEAGASGGEDAGNQDYDPGTAGQDGQGEQGQGEQGQADGQQDPSEDPDIQQLQNFGGPVNDNFPEGLFPPGLLTREDIDEIRKQQEKQQKEAEEKERQQQAQQNPNGAQGGGGQDYDYGNNGGDDGSGGAEGEQPQEGGEEGASPEGVDGNVGGEAAGPETTQVATQEPKVATGQVLDLSNKQSQQSQPTISNSPPNAYQNSYQAIQPTHQQIPQHQNSVSRIPLQPSIEYGADQPITNTIGGNLPSGHPMKNRFNYQPGVQYDQPTYQPMGNLGYQATTPAPMMNAFGHQPGYQPANAGPMNTAYGSMPNQNQNPQYSGFLNQQQQPQYRQSQFGRHPGVRLNWPTPAPVQTMYNNPHNNGGFGGAPRPNYPTPTRFHGYNPDQANEINTDSYSNNNNINNNGQYDQYRPVPYRPALNTFNSAGASGQQSPRPLYPQHRPPNRAQFL